MRNNKFNLPYNPKLKPLARALRKAHNLSEMRFWNRIKHKKFLGLDFDRQRIIGNYIVDFYCHTKLVVIEIDGQSHHNNETKDLDRDKFLQGLGLTVIRIDVYDIIHHIDDVMKRLELHPVFAEDIK